MNTAEKLYKEYQDHKNCLRLLRKMERLMIYNYGSHYEAVYTFKDGSKLVCRDRGIFTK